MVWWFTAQTCLAVHGDKEEVPIFHNGLVIAWPAKSRDYEKSQFRMMFYPLDANSHLNLDLPLSSVKGCFYWYHGKLCVVVIPTSEPVPPGDHKVRLRSEGAGQELQPLSSCLVSRVQYTDVIFRETSYPGCKKNLINLILCTFVLTTCLVAWLCHLELHCLVIMTIEKPAFWIISIDGGDVSKLDVSKPKVLSTFYYFRWWFRRFPLWETATHAVARWKCGAFEEGLQPRARWIATANHQFLRR